MKNTLKKLLCLLLVFLFIFSTVACSKDEDEGDDDESSSSEKPSSSDGPKYEEIIIIFDYSDNEGVVWDEDFDEELVVEANERIGSLPKPTLAGHSFDGWYDEDDVKMRTTTKLDGSVEEVVFYAKFVESAEGDSGSGTNFNCAKGVHNWKTIREPATCDTAGTSTRFCQICNIDEIDAMYSVQNPALGHQWVEDGAIDDGGWTYIALARQRTCKREGCGKKETKQLENLTSQAQLSVSLDAGAWPGTAEWPAHLTDGKWETGPNNKGCTPKGGGPLTITFLFTKAVEIDQIAISCVGLSDDKYKIEVYLMYADENDFGEASVHAGTILTTNGTRETAYIIDRTMDDRPITGIKIVQATTNNGLELWREIAVGRIPDEE